MQLKGINSECKNEAVALAFKKAGYKLLEHRVRWPRKRFNSTVGVSKDVRMLEVIGKVN